MVMLVLWIDISGIGEAQSKLNTHVEVFEWYPGITAGKKQSTGPHAMEAKRMSPENTPLIRHKCRCVTTELHSGVVQGDAGLRWVTGEGSFSLKEREG